MGGAVSELDRAKAIAARIMPRANPEFTCFLVAAAVAGLRGLGMRHIRVGTVFWPDKFKDDPGLSMRGGWGCEGYSEADGRLFLSGDYVDGDGGFNGHTWVEDEPESVIDLMHDYDNGMREVYGEDFKVIGRYIPRTKLERSVKGFWRPQMLDAIRAGKNSVK